ncbi:MAG TPA: DUF2911 domain-containing protein [Chitinophagaceae bacterium]
MIKLAFSYFAVCAVLISCTNKNKRTNDETRTKLDSVVVNTPANPYSPIDLSPMDMSYFPVNYSQRKMTHEIITPPVMRVIYSRPHRQGRSIFGDLLKYGEPWRLGANEASEIEFFRNVTIQNKKVTAGRYIIYSIPYENKWTIILNNDLYTWGLKIDSTKDLIRFDIPIKKTTVDFEYFTMVFQPINDGADLVMAWDDTEARLPINF